MKPSRGGRLGFAAGLALALPFAGSTAAQAQEKRELTVMTQNLYLGSSLNAGPRGHDRRGVGGRRRRDLRDHGVHRLPDRGPRRSRTRSQAQRARPHRAAGGVELDRRHGYVTGTAAAELRLPGDPAGRTGRAGPVTTRWPRSRRTPTSARHRSSPGIRLCCTPPAFVLRCVAGGPRRHPRQQPHTSGAPLVATPRTAATHKQTFTPPGGAPLSFDRGWARVDVKYRGQQVPLRQHPPRGRRLRRRSRRRRPVSSSPAR